MNADDVTELLRDMRHQAGLSQSELGKRLGYAGVSLVVEYETDGGIYGMPTLPMVGRWAAACGFHAELVVTRPGTGPTRVVKLNDKVTP